MSTTQSRSSLHDDRRAGASLSRPGLLGDFLHAWRVFWVGVSFLGFFTGGLLLSWVVLPIAWLIPGSPADHRRRCQRIVGRCFVVFHDFMRLELPPPPFVMVANHPTLVDVTALLSVCPELACVAKPAMFRSWLVGPLLRACGHIEGAKDVFSGVAVVRQMLERLEGGLPVLLFPEGMRSPARGLGSFQAGALEVAARAHVPLVPAFLTCDPPALMRGQPWYVFPKGRAQLRLETLPAIPPRPTAASVEQAESLERSYREKVRAFYGAGEGARAASASLSRAV